MPDPGSPEAAKTPANGAVPAGEWPWTRLEAAILAAAAGGDTLDVTDDIEWPELDRHVEAAFVRALYLGRHDVELDPRGPKLVGVAIDGDLDFTHATVDVPIRIERCELNGRLLLTHARVQSVILGPRFAAATCHADGVHVDGVFELSDAKLGTDEADDALRLDGAEVSGGVYLKDGFHATGEVRAVGARLGGQWSMKAASIDRPDGDALSLDEADISGGVYLDGGFNAVGTVRAVGARVGGQWSMQRAKVTCPAGDAVLLDGAEIGGGVFLDQQFVAIGTVRALAARIVGQWSMQAAKVTCPAGDAVLLDGAEITGGGVYMDERFDATGTVRAIGARVGGGWRMRSATLRQSADGVALALDRAEITGDLRLDKMHVGEPLSMRNTRVTGVLIDDLTSWPENSGLDGFEYRLPLDLRAAAWSAAERSAWLNGMAFSTQAYRHLADRYRARGMPEDADAVMIAMRRRQRQLRPPFELSRWGRVKRAARQAGDWLLDVTTGYGYRPTRIVVVAVAVLVATIIALTLGPVQDRLVAAGTDELVWNAKSTLVAPEPPPDSPPTPPGEGCTDDPTVTCFQPVLYAIDTVVPLVDLDQRATWDVDGAASGGWLLQTALDVARLLGWLVVAAITFVVARHFQTRHG